MQKYLQIAVAILLISGIFISDLDAQKRTTSRRSRSAEPEQSIAEQWFAIHLGNVQFGQGFSLSGKFSYALEFKERFSVGVDAKIFYDFINRFNSPDLNLLSPGGDAFVRIKITNDIFLQGTYGYTSFDQGSNNLREGIFFPSVGGGYKSGVGKWNYGFHILFPLDEVARDYLNLEYWIDFNYNF